MEHLVTLIGCDLDQMERSVTRTGWSQWASAGALASCTWAAFSVLGSDASNVSIFLALATAAGLVGTGMKLAGGLIAPVSTNVERESRFRILSAQYSSSRLPALILAALAGAQIWVLFHLPEMVPQPAFVAAVVLAFAQAAFCCAVLVVSFVDLPSAQTPPRRKALVVSALALIAAAYVWSGTCVWLAQLPSGWRIQLDNIKMAALLNAMAYLVIILSRGPQPAALESALTDLRRELLTGAIDADDATKRYMTISAGMKVEEVLQRDVAAIVSALSHLDGSYRELVEQTRLLKCAVVDNSDTSIQRARNARQKLQVTQSRTAEVGRAMRRMKRTARALAMYDSACAGEVDVVLAGLSSHVDEWSAKIQELQQEVIDLLEATEEALGVPKPGDP